jgi:uncharacterized protein YndB with AHSA1/START domain
MNTDRIEKRILLRAPLERVWLAISDAAEFGSWFGMKVDGPFVPGAHLHAVVVPTTVDPKVAASQKTYEGTPFELMIEQMSPHRLFSFRWHPFAIDPNVDYSAEPTTLVTLTLEETEGGVMLTITESGFDGIPLERRAKAFAANEGGWSTMVGLISLYVTGAQ